MAQISILGLGLMGAALARSLHAHGHDLVVWNRSPDKAVAFRDAGVTCAATVADALRSSPITLICLNKYETVQALLSQSEARAALQDRGIIQLGSSTPNEADAFAQWCVAGGARYLDGAILGSPSAVEEGRANILLAGDASVYAGAEPMLTAFGDGAVTYLGDNVREPSVLDMAWLMQWYGMFIAGAQIAAICASEDLPLDRYIEIESNDLIKRFLRDVQAGSETPRAATLRVWAEALAHIRDHGRERGANTEFPDLMGSLFARAIEAGYGEHDVTAVAKVLQQDTRHASHSDDSAGTE